MIVEVPLGAYCFGIDTAHLSTLVEEDGEKKSRSVASYCVVCLCCKDGSFDCDFLCRKSCCRCGYIISSGLGSLWLLIQKRLKLTPSQVVKVNLSPWPIKLTQRVVRPKLGPKLRNTKLALTRRSLVLSFGSAYETPRVTDLMARRL